MKKLFVIAFLICAAMTLRADSAAEKLETLAKGHITGVTGIKTNTDGSIRSLLVVGRAPINRVLDADDAEASAREDAEISASAAFSEYLNKTVTVSRRRVVAVKTASATNAEDGKAEKTAAAEVVNVKSQEFSSLSKAALSGMKEIYAGIHNGKYVIVYAWDKDECVQLRDVILTMSDTTQSAIKEAKDAESRLAAPEGAVQAPVPDRRGGGSCEVRPAPVLREGGNAVPEAEKYL